MNPRESAAQTMVRRGREALVRSGFNVTSARELAQAAGLSDDAVAQNFGRADDLLGLVIRSITEGVKDRISAVTPEGRSAREFLLDHAENYLRCILQPDAVRCFRFACGLANAHPEISTQFKATARDGNAEFAVILEMETDILLPEGLTYNDAAAQFYALCRGGFHHQLVFDVDFTLTDGEIAAQARKAVTTFLNAFPPEAEC